VTVPLSHTPLILTALFLSQLIHELGHALSAALESVPLLSVGASFTLVLPAAHVALSTPMYAALDARKRGRVVSAGPAHNFGMWVGLVLLRKSGLGEVVKWAGWRMVEGGVGVWNVENVRSPLRFFRFRGSTSLLYL
jgi:S2P endopeptidase